jgi:uncharacterized protein YdeI (YjbR/CyaY-like superfamily)
MQPSGGRSMVGVSASVRSAAGVAGGDELDVDIELDLEPRRVAAPPELHAALAAEPDLLRRFEGLSYSNQLRLAAPVAAAKSAETRQRRMDKACADLRRA